jgi:hypothetical protein
LNFVCINEDINIENMYYDICDSCYISVIDYDLETTKIL